VQRHDEAGLANYLSVAPHAQRAHPTPDHYLPLPFAFGSAKAGAPVTVLEGGMRYGMLSMESYAFGAG
jgi:4,5-DOPA dioxygenase extradiol